MKKRKIIGLLMLMLPVLAFAQASGGQVKKPVKKTSVRNNSAQLKKRPSRPAKNIQPTMMSDMDKMSMILKDILERPMGKVPIDHNKESIDNLKNAISSYYKVEESRQAFCDLLWADSCNNKKLLNYNYHGFTLFEYRISDYKDSHLRSITYRLYASKTNMQLPDSSFDKLIEDLNGLGISISITRQNGSAWGNIKKGDIDYSVDLLNNDTYWSLEVVKAIFKN